VNTYAEVLVLIVMNFFPLNFSINVCATSSDVTIYEISKYSGKDACDH
jgi:hypothetical protein